MDPTRPWRPINNLSIIPIAVGKLYCWKHRSHMIQFILQKDHLGLCIGKIDPMIWFLNLFTFDIQGQQFLGCSDHPVPGKEVLAAFLASVHQIHPTPHAQQKQTLPDIARRPQRGVGNLREVHKLRSSFWSYTQFSQCVSGTQTFPQTLQGRLIQLLIGSQKLCVGQHGMQCGGPLAILNQRRIRNSPDTEPVREGN